MSKQLLAGPNWNVRKDPKMKCLVFRISFYPGLSSGVNFKYTYMHMFFLVCRIGFGFYWSELECSFQLRYYNLISLKQHPVVKNLNLGSSTCGQTLVRSSGYYKLCGEVCLCWQYSYYSNVIVHL